MGGEVKAQLELFFKNWFNKDRKPRQTGQKGLSIIGQRNRLQYIILGLLNQRSQTGYDLTKAFDHEIGEFWQAQHSQIYPMLKRMETDGEITHQDAVTGEKLAKKVYQLTHKGRQKLEAWISEPSPELTATKDEFILKLYFIRSADDPRIPAMIHEQVTLHQAQLDHLHLRMATVFPDQAAIDAAYGHYLILEHAIERETQYLAWLNRH